MSGASFGTPAGAVHICASGETVTYIGFEKRYVTEEITEVIEMTMTQLDEYFDGERKEFSVPFTVGGSELQRRVCDSLMRIPYGETRTYKEIAADAGFPLAVRAVASAVGKNPISIVIPCHRVIGSDGKMRGYAGGIPFKEYLLEVEGRRPRKN
ncbi:MAG: methylated-DNA--[protein]-cysteine S-methyltransferase [Methanomassiliicoccaceae archaeon]|nr:methylated-DNA--[protein]-cysteine S-methyltransferase [Methanomassiliicoccaceae archaeon]